MFFRKRKSLKEKYDDSLYQTMEQLKEEWAYQERLHKLTKEHTEESDIVKKLAKTTYFYLFKEAKVRNLTGSPERISLHNKESRLR